MGDATAGEEPGWLSDALETLPDGVVVFDADWLVGYVNSAGATLLGRPAAEVVGRSLWVALPEMVGTTFHSFLWQARASSGPVTWTGLYAPSGRWLRASATHVDGRLQVAFWDTARAVPGSAGQAVAAVVGAEEDDRERLRYLAEVSDALISTLDTGESATKLAELAVRRLCDWAAVALFDEGGRREDAWAHRDPHRLADLATYMTGRVPGTGDDQALVAALLGGEPVQVLAVREDLVAPSLPTEEVRAAWRRLHSATTTVVPLRARGATFGTLALVNTGTRPPHSALEIATAVEVARRGALALDNARLYGRQLKVAATLQHSMLSPPPQPDDLQIAVRYRPAAADQHVGGDWYDAFAQPDGATLLVIGDVVGHNIDAAAAMGQIRAFVRGIAYDRPETPAQVLTRVDAVLTGLDVATLATALVARIEQTAEQAAAGVRALRWSSAGHLPPVLLRPDGTLALLTSAPERLLGAGTRVPRSDHVLLLQPGDAVLFYTDGIIEHGRTGIDEGTARLVAHLAEIGPLPLEALCDALLDRVPPGTADDDIALLAVRVDRQDGSGPAAASPAGS